MGKKRRRPWGCGRDGGGLSHVMPEPESTAMPGKGIRGVAWRNDDWIDRWGWEERT